MEREESKALQYTRPEDEIEQLSFKDALQRRTSTPPTCEAGLEGNQDASAQPAGLQKDRAINTLEPEQASNSDSLMSAWNPGSSDRSKTLTYQLQEPAPQKLGEEQQDQAQVVGSSQGERWKTFLTTITSWFLPWIPERLASLGYRQLNKWWPALSRKLQRAYATALEPMDSKLHPYRATVKTFDQIPSHGRESSEILTDLQRMVSRETLKWERGYASGAVYSGEREHIAFQSQVYALSSQMNPLHADIWPSCVKFEAEVVRMTANMLHGGPDVCGVVTSGGTESILLACKTYRDWGRAERGIRRPEIVIPSTAHAAFYKAAQYFGLRLRIAAVDPETFQVRLANVRKLLNRNTVLLVGSAPQFPHGIIDPIAELAELARKRRIGCHVDACLGGFMVPWIEKLQESYPDEAHLQSLSVPVVDFRIPGVTSISVDTHKYGYAAKGTSVILYASTDWRRYQFFTLTDWSGGMYFSPTLAGSRPGGLIAACWAAMLRMGESGYLKATDRILRAAHELKSGIRNTFPELRILGEPLWVIAFAAADPARLDIYRVLDAMTERGWSLNGLHRPACIHICLTLRHCEQGVVARFLKDLRESVDASIQPHGAGENPGNDGMAPIYGIGGTLPVRGIVADLLLAYMDLLYRV
jgi:glutamate/tyrosine decarboxylase-like PLP-dependent enzyme